MKHSTILLVCSTLLFACQSEPTKPPKPDKWPTTKVEPNRDLGELGIPIIENTKDYPAPAYPNADLDQTLGRDRCAICADYKCIEAGGSHQKDEKVRMGYKCDVYPWKEGAPRYVKLNDGSMWEYIGKGYKC